MATQWQSDSLVLCSCFSTTDLQKQLWFLGERDRLGWSAERLFKATSQNWGICCSCACFSLALCLKHCLCQVQNFRRLCSGAVLACFCWPRGRDCTYNLALWILFVFISSVLCWILYFSNIPYLFFIFFLSIAFGWFFLWSGLKKEHNFLKNSEKKNYFHSTINVFYRHHIL